MTRELNSGEVVKLADMDGDNETDVLHDRKLSDHCFDLLDDNLSGCTLCSVTIVLILRRALYAHTAAPTAWRPQPTSMDHHQSYWSCLTPDTTTMAARWRWGR